MRTFVLAALLLLALSSPDRASARPDGEGEPSRMTGRLESFDDGVVRLSRKLSPEGARLALKRGAREVTELAHASDHAVFNGRYYRTFRVGDVEGIKGPHDAYFADRVGQIVTLVIARVPPGFLRVIDVEDAPPSHER